MAKPRADVVTTYAIGAKTARALSRGRAARSKGYLALTQTITSAWIALVPWIRIRRDTHARSNVVLHVARLTRTHTRLIATNTIDAIARGTLRIHHARIAIGQLTRAHAIACTGIAFVARIQVYENGTARPVCALTLERTRTRLAGAHTSGIATISVDTEVTRAICGNGTRRTHDPLAIAEAITLPRIAFIARIGIGRNV